MKHGRVLLLVVFGLLVIALPGGGAKSSPLVAFVNSSGQLIVSSGDGSYRWIVTNPGETLAGDTAWTGNRLLFAVARRKSSLRGCRTPASQAVSEIGHAVRHAAVGFARRQDSSLSAARRQLRASAADRRRQRGALPLSNDRGARYSGLWSDSARWSPTGAMPGTAPSASTDAAVGET